MRSAPDNAHPPSRSRQARIEVRLSALQKAHIRQAAALRGQTLSEFVLASATDAARQIVDEHATIWLTCREQEAFVAALLDSPVANARLLRAAQAYRRRQNDTP